MLIRNAEIWSGGPNRTCGDVRVTAGRIAEIGALPPLPGEEVIHAGGGLLLPGLHDHHIHLAALAAQQSSVSCGSPQVTDAQQLALALKVPGTGWLRAVDFHESILGGALPDVAALDRLVPDRPLRMQHRTGRMWLLNSRALETLLANADAPPGLERDGDRYTGRLFDEDQWLRKALGSTLPDFAGTSERLARFGVTGLTDMSPRNDPSVAQHFAQQIANGHLLQSVTLAGTLALAKGLPAPCTLGPVKLHLHENALPDFDETLALIRAARAQRRAIAVHCVTEVELVFTLALLETAGCVPGDRIEHVSIAAPDLVERMARLGLAACAQPHFIAEHGTRYLAEVEPHHHADLYRLRTLMNAGIAISAGTDAPYGNPDPWRSMAAAVSRRTTNGVVISAQEAVSPEKALGFYLADPADFSRQRSIEPGSIADLCLLDRPWSQARTRLRSDDVSLVLAAGKLIYQRVDKAPFKRLAGADAPA
ncbi:amidohydrolase family protein [Novosphingobium guangzhouense]|uniref:Hydrolase n=1 Tax=Novosphingobium guangzhouense TaxID=1850347 RepID=A0A2K2G1T3_9SPHN|nr:amidohydrolase family protein [Novosphingobium guangzhouense]PNU04993.1 hydrolase [Novosphingobium guangzhouense]